MEHRPFIRVVLLLLIVTGLPVSADAQSPSAGPPAVGVVRAERQQITESEEFIGRVQAVGRVALVARVSAFLEKRPRSSRAISSMSSSSPRSRLRSMPTRRKSINSWRSTATPN